jgi:hypothetical protein
MRYIVKLHHFLRYPINKSATIEVIRKSIVEHKLRESKKKTLEIVPLLWTRDHLCHAFWEFSH